MPKYDSPGIAPAIFYKPGACPIRSVTHRIGGKWPMLVLCHLSFGDHRFTQLLGAIPDISQRMLTQTLRRLEEDGLVVRTVTAEVPPRVDYALSESGKSLLPILQDLLHWGARNRSEIETSRLAYEAAHPVKQMPTTRNQPSNRDLLMRRPA